MKKRTALMLIATHIAVAGLGFAIGIYTLPILIAPPAPTEAQISEHSPQAKYTAEFERDRKDSDALHWGEGTLSVGDEAITFLGKLAPGPAYKLYLSPEFVETEADFEEHKNTMVEIGNIDTFNNFIVDVPTDVDPSSYTSAIVWCESFEEFITSTQYK